LRSRKSEKKKGFSPKKGTEDFSQEKKKPSVECAEEKKRETTAPRAAAKKR